LVISKIAAGEVIKRPASVVKELIENSIDAAATEIQLTIKKGGKDLIEVKDNGVGISPKDLPLAIKRHATSKIRSEEDLSSIMTMGFRGEALYSIASVSRFSISSRRAVDELATCVTVEGDVDKSQISEKVLALPGTVIQVRDLFYNYPVRRKFLKKESIEEANIFDIIAQCAVGHPQTSFIYIVDEELEFQTIKNQNHLFAIKKVFGKEIADCLIDIGITQRDKLLIHGFLSKPESNRRNRKFQHFFLNGRRIHSKLLQSALEEGYGTYLMKHEFPIAFLFLELDPEYFDVNIHPQKQEVLFFDEKELMIAVSSAVSHCLKTYKIVPHLTTQSKQEKQTQLTMGRNTLPNSSSPPQDFGSIDKNQIIKVIPDIKPSRLSNTVESSEAGLSKVSAKKSEVISFFGSEIKFRGQLGKEFLLFEDLSANDLIILDFHAAHERINLEKLKAMQKTNKISVQTLLRPFRFFLTPRQRLFIMDLLSSLNDLGFDIRSPKGKKREIEVHSIPKILVKTDLKDFLTSLLDTLSISNVDERISEILSLIACHCSYRAGDVLSFHQSAEIIEGLIKTQDPTICAHGRPTYIRLPYQYLLKQVRRI
jgi:DNA mismatch repair protein MutL